MGGTTKRESGSPQEIMPLRNSIIDAFMSGNIRPNSGQNTYNQSWMNSQRAISPPASSGPMMYPSYGNPGFGGMQRNYGFAGRLPMELSRRSAAPSTPGFGGASTDFLDMLNSGIFTSGPSLDTFLDPSSPMFQGIRGGYEDMFTQRRAEALAQAKEASGNLTGSGYANNLGGVVNRGLADENAMLTNIMTQLGLTQYGQENNNAQNNAMRFLQFLMGMSGGGVGPDNFIQSGGPGQILGPIATGIGTWLGGPAVGAAAGGIAGGGK